MTFFRVATLGLFSTLLIPAHTFAQAKKTVVKATAPARPAAARPAAAAAGVKAVFSNSNDSLSYSIGYSIAQSLKQQKMNDINTTVMAQAVSDALKGRPLAISEGQMQTLMMNYMQKQQMSRMAEQSKAAEGNKKIGAAFLAENKSKPGVQTTASGLQYVVEKEGTGAKPAATDRVKVHYTGTLLDGKVFDSSVQQGQPAEFGVTEVIKGWTEVLQLMPVGSKWKVFIPSDIAYGDRGAGSDIGPGATLIFDIELLDIVKAN
jgi:FKBP-type peptidyl-prolyl cis-trans isomerase FklB